MQIKFSETFALVSGPTGALSVMDLTEEGRFITINAFLFQKWNPWSATDKTALRAVCNSLGLDVSKPNFSGYRAA